MESLGEWTSLWEASPASRLAQQESSGARQTTATSGQRCCALFDTSSPLGSLWRTLLTSPAWHSTLCSLTWRPQGTKRGRLYFQLAPWVRRTSGSGSSLWLTPSASDGAGSRTLPTGTSPTGRRPDGKKAQVGLNNQVRLWPTPRTEGFDAGGHRGSPDSLHAAVKLWPTPNAVDGTGGKLRKGISPTGRLPSGKKGQVSLSQATKEFAVSAWPTPTSRDYRSGTGAQYRGHSQQLPERVQGMLNPAWVESLMGFPPGWTDVT